MTWWKAALAAYEAALECYTPQTAPLDYAQTQYNLGIVYGDLAKIEEGEANFKRAISAYEAALEYYTLALVTWTTAAEFAGGGDTAWVRQTYGATLQKHISALSVRPGWNPAGRFK